MKKIISLILVMSLLLSLSACSKKSTETENAQTEAAASLVDVQEETADEAEAANETEAPVVEASEPIKAWDGSFETLQILNHREYEYFWGEAKHSIIDVHYPIIKLDAAGEVHFPELVKSIDAMNASIESDIMDSLDDLTKGAQESLKSLEEEYGEQAFEYYWTFSDIYDAYIMRADSNVTSILMKNESYTGGAHPNSYLLSYNFDTQSGKELKLEDVVTDMPAFAKLVKEFVATYYEAGTLFDDTDVNNLLSYGYSWTLGNDGVRVYFNPYEIGPYASGVITATVAYDGNEGVFNDKYTEHVKNYYQELVSFIPNYYDVDGDGKYEYLAADQTIDPATQMATSIMVVDGRRAETKSESHTLRTFAVKNNDKTYAYQFMNLNTNYPYTKIYELTSKEPEDVAEEYYWLPTVYDDQRRAFEMVPNDADHTKLAMKLWLLGTYSGNKDYFIDDHGTPMTDEKVFEIYAAPPLTFLKSAEFDAVNEKGEVIGTRKSHVADKLTLYRTDYESFVDGKFEDGTIIRMQVDISGSPFLVNGIIETELFDGIAYYS